MTLEETWADMVEDRSVWQEDCNQTPYGLPPPPDYAGYHRLEPFPRDAVLALAIAEFRGEARGFGLAWDVLKRYGVGVPAVSDAALAATRQNGSFAGLLFIVDRPRVYALGLHKDPRTAHEVRIEALRTPPVRDYLERMLREAPDTLCFQRNNVKEMRLHVAELLPLLRARLPASALVLAAARRPEDAAAVLASGCRERELIPWLGSLEGSEVLTPKNDMAALFDLLRRRRCAGLPHAPVPWRERLRAAMTQRRAGDAPDIARVIMETRDPEWTPRLASLLENHYAWSDKDPVALALVAFPESLPTPATGAVPSQLHRIVTTYSLPDWKALAEAAQSPSEAYAAFAWALWSDPHDARAARRCAELEEAAGTPISARREAWIQSLGTNARTV